MATINPFAPSSTTVIPAGDRVNKTNPKMEKKTDFVKGAAVHERNSSRRTDSSANPTPELQREDRSENGADGGTPVAAPAKPVQNQTTVCKFWAERRSCRNGDQCRFKHPSNEVISRPAEERTSKPKRNGGSGQTKVPPLPEQDVPVEDPAGAVCIVCAEAIDHRARLSTLAPCGHRDCCSNCALRLRVVHQDKRCPSCNVEATAMVLVPSRAFEWSSVTLPSQPDSTPTPSGDVSGGGGGGGVSGGGSGASTGPAHYPGGVLELHPESGLYMPRSFRTGVVSKLVGFHCGQPLLASDEPPPAAATAPAVIGAPPGTGPPGLAPPLPPAPPAPPALTPASTPVAQACCQASFPDAKALAKHLRDRHDLQFCKICAEHKPCFCSELRRFSCSKPHDLEKHLTEGDYKGEGFKGHPKVRLGKVRHTKFSRRFF